MRGPSNQKIPGFYVAHHPWFDTEYGAGRLYKVGHTDDLRRRLVDGGYTTCFTPGFRYVHTVETRTKDDAHRLETAVLHCAAARRIARSDTTAVSELVRMRLGEIASLANQVAGALEIAGTVQTNPSYPRPPPRKQASSAGQPAPAQLTPVETADLAGLAVPPVEDQLSDYVGDLLAGLTLDEPPAPVVGGGEQKAPEPPKPKTAADYLREARDAAAPPAAPADDYEETDEEFADFVMLPDAGGLSVADLCADFDALNINSYEVLEKPLEDRPYQTAAIQASIQELADTKRAILQMACRCGKTRVAHGVIQDYLEKPRTGKRPVVLYLVPGLALLRQTAQKLDRYGIDADVLLVGSDDRPLTGLVSLTPALRGGTAAGTTDPDEIRRACEDAETPRPLLVISTYQSSPLLPDVFDLAVFDESHRVCGDVRVRPFTHVLLNHEVGDRLYMTATPRYDAPLSMKDRSRFGGVAYAYHMREGIDAGYVNDFGLEIVGREKEAGLDDKLATADQVVAALARLDEATANCGKLLVFCRSIRHAATLRQDVEAALALARGEGAQTACLCAHSRMSRAEIAENLARFCAPGAPAVLFNCRLFQEGVEIPTLNGVFFASPRHSPRDIIQSLCRPLNVLPGKPPSKVFIPVAYDPAADPDAPANLERFASIVPYFDALVAEDPLLYEHLLDPRGTPYPLEWVDSAVSCGKKPMRYRPDKLLSAARRSVRRGGNGKTERLLRAAKIPWEIGFGELQRVVTECGRYPKTTDCFVYGDAKVNFGQFYRYARDSYAKWQAGKIQPLEPHQLHALAALPGWDPYGLEGPYPWKETLAFLDRWLTENGGVPPMVEINKGGYVGLEATPMERLSGTLTCINQSDGRDRKSRDGAPRPGSGFTLDADKRKDLDELCAKHGLRWRKERHPPPEGAPEGSVGSLVENDKGEYIGAKTFIQEAYSRFKEEWYGKGKESDYVRRWFPDYPLKHAHQERLDVWARRKEVVPPRWRGRGKAAKGEFDAHKSVYL
jgi:superfamily II DNA or RNA helicase